MAVRKDLPPAFARDTGAGEGCRAGAQRAQAGRPHPPRGLRLGEPFFEGIAQSAERVRHMHQVEGALQFAIANKPVWGIHIARLGKPIPSALTILSLWCSPDNMPASHAGDHRSKAGQGRHFRRVVRGEKQTHLIQNQAALDVQVVSRRPFCPQSIVSDALAR